MTLEGAQEAMRVKSDQAGKEEKDRAERKERSERLEQLKRENAAILEKMAQVEATIKNGTPLPDEELKKDPYANIR